MSLPPPRQAQETSVCCSSPKMLATSDAILKRLEKHDAQLQRIESEIALTTGEVNQPNSLEEGVIPIERAKPMAQMQVPRIRFDFGLGTFVRAMQAPCTAFQEDTMATQDIPVSPQVISKSLSPEEMREEYAATLRDSYLARLASTPTLQISPGQDALRQIARSAAKADKLEQVSPASVEAGITAQEIEECDQNLLKRLGLKGTNLTDAVSELVDRQRSEEVATLRKEKERNKPMEEEKREDAPIGPARVALKKNQEPEDLCNRQGDELKEPGHHARKNPSVSPSYGHRALPMSYDDENGTRRTDGLRLEIRREEPILYSADVYRRVIVDEYLSHLSRNIERAPSTRETAIYIRPADLDLFHLMEEVLQTTGYTYVLEREKEYPMGVALVVKW